MAYDFSGTGFGGGGALVGAYGEDETGADPMSGLANLSDVMLVLACGLMLALVTYFNLDLPSVVEMDATSMEEISESDVEKIQDAVDAQGGGYTELGMVYQDPNTGKMYMIQQEEESGATPGVTPTEGADAGAADTEGE